MISPVQQRHQSAGNGAHTRGENQGFLAALQAGDHLSQSGAVWVAGPYIGVDVYKRQDL